MFSTQSGKHEMAIDQNDTHVLVASNGVFVICERIKHAGHKEVLNFVCIYRETQLEKLIEDWFNLTGSQYKFQYLVYILKGTKIN